jgi:hypothetical protein
MIAPPAFSSFSQVGHRTRRLVVVVCYSTPDGTVVCGSPAFGCGWRRASRRVRRNARLGVKVVIALLNSTVRAAAGLDCKCYWARKFGRWQVVLGSSWLAHGCRYKNGEARKAVPPWRDFGDGCGRQDVTLTQLMTTVAFGTLDGPEQA